MKIKGGFTNQLAGAVKIPITLHFGYREIWRACHRRYRLSRYDGLSPDAALARALALAYDLAPSGLIADALSDLYILAPGPDASLAWRVFTRQKRTLDSDPRYLKDALESQNWIDALGFRLSILRNTHSDQARRKESPNARILRWRDIDDDTLTYST